MGKDKLSKICAALGIILMIAALGVAVHNLKEERSAKQESAMVLGKIGEAIPEGVTRKDNAAIEDPEEWEIPSYVLDPDREMPEIEVDGYRYIGVLEVPSIELELPIMSAWDDEKLKVTPCRYKGSAYQNDLIIAGHNYRAHFSPLKNFTGGEEVVFTDVEGNQFVYEVGAVEIMKGMEVERMESGEWDLTLFTCTYNGQSRFALRCNLVDSYAQPAEWAGRNIEN